MVQGEMPFSDVEETVVYTKRNDLGYTIHYKEQGFVTKLTEDKVTNKNLMKL